MGDRTTNQPASISKLYTFRVDLLEGPTIDKKARETISRTIQAAGGQSLDTLHRAIFQAFDRSDERLYEFNLGQTPSDAAGNRYTFHDAYEDAAREELVAVDTAATSIGSLGLTAGRTFGYVFDFGDYWVHRITVVSVEDASPDSDLPLVIESEGESPPQHPPTADKPETPSPDAEEPALAAEADMTDVMMLYLQAEWRAEIEAKGIRRNTTLQAALNKLPAHWVEAICVHKGLPRLNRAKERVRVLVEQLPTEESLTASWNHLPEPSRRMLKWIVVDGEGAVSLQELSETFGPDTDRTWYWDEGETPTTPLGLIRLHGLAFVGMMRDRGEKRQFAVVPVELRDKLCRLAEAPGAFDNAPPMPAQRAEEQISIDDRQIEEQLRKMAFGAPPPPPAPKEDEESELTELDHFLQMYPFSRLNEPLYVTVAEKIMSSPRDFHPAAIRELVDRMIAEGKADTRLAAYKLGAIVFGGNYAQAALEDDSQTITAWAGDYLNTALDDE